jgi:hypothetical protein
MGNFFKSVNRKTLLSSKLKPSNLTSFDDQAPKNGSDAQKVAIETLLIGNDAAFNKCIQPEFIRLAPPPMPLASDEVRSCL